MWYFNLMFDAQEYTSMKCKEKEDEIELRRMRTENSLLRQRIEMLETESSDLADRLIQGQVTRAEVEETTFAMKRELSAIKQHDIDTNEKLNEAKERYHPLNSSSNEYSWLYPLGITNCIRYKKPHQSGCWPNMTLLYH